MERTGSPETSVTTNQRCVTSQKSKEIINTAAGISKPFFKDGSFRSNPQVKVKKSVYRPGQAPEGTRRLRLPDLKTIGS